MASQLGSVGRIGMRGIDAGKNEEVSMIKKQTVMCGIIPCK